MNALGRCFFRSNAAAAAVVGGGAAAPAQMNRRWLRRSTHQQQQHRPVRHMALPLVVAEVLTRGVDVHDGAAGSAELTVRGWIRSVRRQKRIAFLNIADGSSLDGYVAIACCQEHSPRSKEM